MLAPPAPLCGFSGSRSLGPGAAPLVAACVAAAGALGLRVAVGCARGADRLVRVAAPGAVVFRAASRQPAALVVRSVALVRAVAGSGPGARFVVFPGGACPAGVVPAPAWCSGGGSGSWASAALAAGLGLALVVFPGAAPLPAWAGSWVPAGSPWPAGGFAFVPAQLQLF